MSIGTYVLIAIVVLAILFAQKAIVIIPQSETRIIERLDDTLQLCNQVSISSFRLSIERKKWWQCAADAMSTRTL